jgi:type IV pilus assembly protein PilY1
MDTQSKASVKWGIVGLALVAATQMCQVEDAHAQALADYTATPPFIADTVPPNVLILMDNSGSMNDSAYHISGQAYDPSREYNGYFGISKCYEFASNRFNPVANKAATGNPCTSSSPWLGNFLNYLTMTKLEIVKWVTMGGKCAPRALNGTCYPGGTMQLETNEYVGSITMDGTGISPYTSTKCFSRSGNNLLVRSSCGSNSSDSYSLNAEISAEPNGIIQAVGNKARFGLMQFKGSGDGGKVVAGVGGNIVSMVNAIENTDASTWTPLAESLYEATRYFAQINPAYANSDFGTTTNSDPYYFTSPDWSSNNPGEYVPCCKSFIMVFTDGQPTQDQNIPSSLRDYADAYHGTHCNNGTSCTLIEHRIDYPDNGSHYLDDVAYWAHKTDLRQATIPVVNESGNDLDGFQNVTVYTFYAFGDGSGREVLQKAAKVGAYEDRNGNNGPDLVEEYDKVNNYTGVAGPDGLPDAYFESADADDLRDKLMAAITSILQRSASGTAVSVLASSATGDGSLYQSYFYPVTFEGTREVKWTGFTQGLFIDSYGNLREDTDGDGRLVYRLDKIIRTRFDSATNNVLVDRYHDNDGDGKADSSTAYETVQLREMKGIWEAGKRLALTAPANRKILTWVDTDNNGLVGSGEVIDFTTTNSTTLGPYLRAAATGTYTADNIINFIRGTQVTGMRDRELTVNGSLAVWKYGDPIHSTPTIVGAPKERFDLLYGDASYTAFFQAYKNRRQVAYVGSNDGMLHAFNSGFYHRGDDPSVGSTEVEHGWYTKNATDNSSGKELGVELWGFIPYQLLPHLQWLTRGDYIHSYYVDLKPKITDVKIFCTSTITSGCVNGQTSVSHPNGWGTILIGGFRMGGSCNACRSGTGAPTMSVSISGTSRDFYSAYFVLDITDPEADPKLLWSFASTDLGLTTSYPTIARTSPSTDAKSDHSNAKWFVVFGSGPTGYKAAIGSGGETQGQAPKLFAVNLIDGPGVGNANVTTMDVDPVNGWKSFMGDLITYDQNLDFRSDSVYGGRTIHPSAGGGSGTRGVSIWTGMMHRLTMGTCSSSCSTATWGIGSSATVRNPTQVLDTFPSSNALKMGPIVAAPTVTLDDSGKTWLFFGTGRYFSAEDKTNTETQYLFGVKDSVMSGNCTGGQTSQTSCLENDLVDVSSAQVCVVGVGTCGGSTNQVTGVSGVTTFTGTGTTSLVGLVKSKEGWYTTLPATRERSLVNPTLIGGIAFFPTFIPDNSLCAVTGSSNLYALFYLTGSAYTESVIGTTSSNGNTIVNRSMSLGTGLAAQMAIHLGSQGSSANGTASTPPGGCQSGVGAFINTSSGNINQSCADLASSPRSRWVAWYNQRD